jgi:hypothetical protein
MIYDKSGDRYDIDNVVGDRVRRGREELIALFARDLARPRDSDDGSLARSFESMVHISEAQLTIPTARERQK